jgi:HlyD family secretion protein
MNTHLFRQVSLERLSSPEQLDQVLQITSPREWAALAAVFLVILTVVVWGYKGTVVTTAAGQGVIIRTGGVINLVTRGGGLVLNLNVKVGDKVRVNQVVATVAQPVLAEKIRTMQQDIAAVVRERERQRQLRSNSARLQVEALERQRANLELRITELGDQAKVAAEQVLADEQLAAKGLITKQQALASEQKFIALQDEVADLQAQVKQLDAQKFSIESQPQQEDAQMRDRISGLQRELAAAQKELTLAENVVSGYDGQVLELKVYPGSMVNNGDPILSVQPEAQGLELIAYVPSSPAKQIEKGMEAQVSPSTIKREEYGFMKGEVAYVSDYPATPTALMRNFENESLARALSSSGPVTEVRVTLQANPSTPSGFQWSASKGPQIMISSGTICTVQIVTRRQRPMSLVFPYLKDKLGLT